MVRRKHSCSVSLIHNHLGLMKLQKTMIVDGRLSCIFCTFFVTISHSCDSPMNDAFLHAFGWKFLRRRSSQEAHQDNHLSKMRCRLVLRTAHMGTKYFT